MTFLELLQQQNELWFGHEPASTAAIDKYEEEAGLSLLPDYRAFLLSSNGGTLRGPKDRFELDRIEYMANYLIDEDILEFLPGMVVFGGTDGGENPIPSGEPIRAGCMGDLLGPAGRLGSRGILALSARDLTEAASRILNGCTDSRQSSRAARESRQVTNLKPCGRTDYFANVPWPSPSRSTVAV